MLPRTLPFLVAFCFVTVLATHAYADTAASEVTEATSTALQAQEEDAPTEESSIANTDTALSHTEDVEPTESAGVSSTTTQTISDTSMPISTLPLLRTEFSALSVRPGIKNRFLSSLQEIESAGTDGDGAREKIEYLKTLIGVQIGVKLTNEEGSRLLQLVEQL